MPDEEEINCDELVFEDATAWAWYEGDGDPGNITVTKVGLRKLLRLVRDCEDLVFASLLKAAGATLPVPEYEQRLSVESQSALLNRLTKVWCECDLIVSGLFVDDDGQPLVNPCAEE